MENSYSEMKIVRPDDRENTALLYVIEGEEVRSFELAGRQTFGRLTENNAPDLALKSLIVSRHHGVFTTDSDGIQFEDTGSSNGTTLNHQKLEPGKPTRLFDGSVLRIHGTNSKGSSHDVVMVVVEERQDTTRWTQIPLNEIAKTLKVGRGQEISLRGRTASRKHATFARAQNGWAIIDNHSLNGVYLNGTRIVEPVLLRPMDVIWIAKHIFVFEDDYLLFQEDRAPEQNGFWHYRPSLSEDPSGESVEKAGFRDRPLEQNDAEQPDVKQKEAEQKEADRKGTGQKHLKKIVRKSSKGKTLSIRIEERSVWLHLRKKRILKNVNLQVESGSLVLILGGSGAGKTTFMNAVMGYEPAQGRILFGKSDIYHDFDKMKYEIGYVPQDDLLRMEDVVYDTLDNAARMRLPETMPEEERTRRVIETLNMFGLSHERGNLVGKISGGQRKRLSIAVEYIGNPSLFFLDEPDSGLDGQNAGELMENLREIADQDKIVMVISHIPDRAYHLFDKVIVLAKTERDDCGHLIYYGSPGDACRFFGTDTLEKIVGRINRRDEGGEGLAEYYMQRFNAQRRSGGQ